MVDVESSIETSLLVLMAVRVLSASSAPGDPMFSMFTLSGVMGTLEVDALEGDRGP